MKETEKMVEENLLTSSENWKLLTCCFSSFSLRKLPTSTTLSSLTPTSPPLSNLKFFQFSTRRKKLFRFGREKEKIWKFLSFFSLNTLHTSRSSFALRLDFRFVRVLHTRSFQPPFGVCSQSSMISLFNYLFQHCWSDRRDDSTRKSETKKVFNFRDEPRKNRQPKITRNLVSWDISREFQPDEENGAWK